MFFNLLGLFGFVFLSSCSTPQFAALPVSRSLSAAPNVQSTFENIVVEIRIEDKRRPEIRWAGSGLIIDRGRILTNSHVVENIEDSQFIQVTAVVKGREIPLKAQVIRDKTCDLALVFPVDAVNGNQLRLKQVSIGDLVTIVGNFEGKGIARTFARISRRNDEAYFRRSSPHPTCQTIQLSSTGIPGGSGGGVFSEDGALGGLLDAREPRAFGIGYAIDASEVERFLSTNP